MIPLWGRKRPGFQELEQKFQEEAAQRQTLQNSIREREEQLARTRLEYEDRVRQEEIRRVTLEAQLQTVIPATPSNITQQTPRDRGNQSSDHGSRSSRHSRRICRTPTNSVAARLAQNCRGYWRTFSFCGVTGRGSWLHQWSKFTW